MSMHLRTPDLATILSIVALFAALGGSACAAARITGASVKDASLSGKDIRDRSLRAKDIRQGALPAGPAGPPGPAGPVGPQGEPGATLAVQRFGPRTPLDLQAKTIVTAPLPAGSWVVTASGLVNNSQSENVSRGAECEIEAGATTIASTGLMNLGVDINGAAKADTDQFSVTGVTSVPAPSQARLTCTRAGGSGVSIEQPSLVAIQVRSLNTETGD